jgi:hypothetical protein
MWYPPQNIPPTGFSQRIILYRERDAGLMSTVSDTQWEEDAPKRILFFKAQAHELDGADQAPP